MPSKMPNPKKQLGFSWLHDPNIGGWALKVLEGMNPSFALWQKLAFKEKGGRNLESQRRLHLLPARSSRLAEGPPPKPEVFQVIHTSDGVNRAISSNHPHPLASCFLDKMKSDYILYRFENKV